MSYKIVLFKRLLKRIVWKLKPVSAEGCLNKIKKRKKEYPTVLGINETINEIKNSGCSIARYGDGEFKLCLGRSIRFQKFDKGLMKRLKQILSKNENDNCITAIIDFDTNNLTKYESRFWYENINDIIPLLKHKPKYYNASITRRATIEQFNQLKTLWDSRNIIFVTGDGSRFNTKHELFDNIANSTIVNGKAENAWSEYDSLVSRVLKEAKTQIDPIIIISLGPTATILAYDLSLNGYQSLDLGHFTNIFDALKYNKELPEKMAVNNNTQ